MSNLSPARIDVRKRIWRVPIRTTTERVSNLELSYNGIMEY